MKLLHLDSSILGADSVSRMLSSAIVERHRALDPDLEIVRRDLVADPLPHLAARPVADPPAGSIEAEVLDEFIAADIVVIGVGFYNFTIPSQLKAWIDRIVVAGRSFRYTATGPEGLAGDKRVVLAIARGGFYGTDTPMAEAEHAERYLKTVFKLIGIAAPKVVLAEGIARGTEQRDKATAAALGEIAALVP